MTYYGKIEILFDIAEDTVVSITSSIHENSGGTPDPSVAATVALWRAEVDAELSQVIGYVKNPIERWMPTMHNMITDAWLISFPLNDIALTNTGGLRQAIPTGDITLDVMIGVQPFENSIMAVSLTGTQIISVFNEVRHAVAGMTAIGGYYLSDGTPLEDNSTYKVLVNSYMWQASQVLGSYDPIPTDTGVNYRQPVIDWITSLNTSSADPLDNYLDTTPRTQ